MWKFCIIRYINFLLGVFSYLYVNNGQFSSHLENTNIMFKKEGTTKFILKKLWWPIKS